MGGVEKAGQPSLERLKALDSLPDLPTQLVEARQLCTHSARTDMVAKWLLEKLKKSADVRSSDEAWQSLTSTLRLLSPERVGVLLASSNFFDTVISAFETGLNQGNLFDSVASAIQFLLEVSAGSGGTSIKALLSLPASQAARFLAIALENAIHKSTAFDTILKVNQQDVLQLGMSIWSLRKHSQDEHELFASHCLVPAADLLVSLTSQQPTDEPGQKRSVSGVDRSSNGQSNGLETLLARHIFLPSRTTLFRAQDSTARRDHSKNGLLDSLLSVETLLKPLKRAVLEDTSHHSTIPLLLDIALRCVSTPTQRQRTKEKPWIEAVFQALFDCNRHKDSGRADLMTVVQMLQVIDARASLSQETLKKLLWEHSILALSLDEADWWERCSNEHWTILTQVLEMDSDIFAEPLLAESVFTRLTKTVQRDITEHVNQTSDSATRPSTAGKIDQWRTRWLHQVLVPILEAFGRRRDLAAFIKMWSQQLEVELKDLLWSPWIELDKHLHSVLEESMTDTQMIELFDHELEKISHPPSHEDQDAMLHFNRKAGASVVILNGVLGSFRSESLADALGAKCEGLLTSLFKLSEILVESSSPSEQVFARIRRIWSLLYKAFELWFPAWLRRQSDRDVVAQTCGWVLSHNAMLMTLLETIRTRLESNSSPAAIMEAGDAECFLASICHHVIPYKEGLEADVQEIVNQALRTLFQHAGTGHSQALLIYPDLLQLQDAPSRSHRLTGLIRAASTDNVDVPFGSSFMTLKAITATSVGRMQIAALEDLVHSAVEAFGGADERRAIQVLLQVPVSSLTRSQRESILDHLCESNVRTSQLGQDSLRTRLALMVKLMGLPNASSKLSTNPSIIWLVVVGADATEYVDPDANAHRKEYPFETLILAEELARLVVKHLLSTQDQERSQTMLLQLSSHAKDVLESCCKPERLHRRVNGLALSKSIIEELETGAKDILRSRLPHRNGQNMAATFEDLLKTIGDMKSKPNDEYSTQLYHYEPSSLHVALSTSCVLFELLQSTTNDDIDDRIGDVFQKILGSFNSPHVSRLTRRNDDVSALRSAFVRPFVMCCTWLATGISSLLAEFALDLLNAPLHPADTKTVIDAFEGHSGRIDGASRAHLAEHIFTTLQSGQLSALKLFQPCLSKLEKDDISNATGSWQYQICPKLLEIAIASEDISKQKQAMSCIFIVLRQKPFLNSQYTVDITLASLPKVLQRKPSGARNFMDVCLLLSALLLSQRARLQGRFHLVNKIYQTLISRLFTPSKEYSSNRMEVKPLGSEHSHALARSLMLFCEPLAPRRQPNATSLTDESRKEQAHVGRFTQSVLHHYCSQILNGTLADGIREALRPGLRSMIEALEMNDADGVKYLSASMNNSERAVLRGVYEDWRRFGKWRGE